MNQPLRVLIVEDSDDEVDLLLRALRQGGYEVTSEVVRRRPPCAPPWHVRHGM